MLWLTITFGERLHSVMNLSFVVLLKIKGHQSRIALKSAIKFVPFFEHENNL